MVPLNIRRLLYRLLADRPVSGANVAFDAIAIS